MPAETDTKHTTERDTRDARYDGMYLGVVVANGPDVDPDGLGRILVQVPGLLEPSSLPAFPIGQMFGVKNGFFWVPEVDANVLVWLHQGDVDHPYYIAGPWGSPDGNSDVPEQAPSGSVDHMVLRWRNFHFTFDGTDAAEKVTLEDLDSGTKIEIDRPTGDYLRDVEGNEVVRVKTDREVTVEEGDETHTVSTGERTTTIQTDDTKTVVAGDDTTTVTAGDSIKTVTAGDEIKNVTAGSSTETIGANKSVNTTGSISQTAGTTITLMAGGLVTIVGSSLSISSGAGATSQTSGGLLTQNFLGGITATIVGAIARTITGAVSHNITGTFARIVSGLATYTFNGGLLMLGTGFQLGLAGTYKPVINNDVIAAINAVITAYNAHTHSGVAAGAASTAGPAPVVASTIIPAGPPPFDATAMTSANVSVT